MYPQIPFFFCPFRTTEDQVKIVKLLLISILSSFPVSLFSFFISSFLQPCLHCLMAIFAN